MKDHNEKTIDMLFASVINKIKKGFCIILKDIKKEHRTLFALLFTSSILTLIYKLLISFPSIFQLNINKILYQFVLAALLLIFFLFFQKKDTCSNRVHMNSVINRVILAIKKEKSIFHKVLTILFTFISCFLMLIIVLTPLWYIIYGIINKDATVIVFSNILYLAAVAICEEMMFRGLLVSLFFIQRSERIIASNFWSIIVTSTMFGLAHLPKASTGAVLSIILMGLICGTILITTRKIELSILFHFEWDVIMTVMCAANKNITVAANDFNSDVPFSVLVLVFIIALLFYWVYKTEKCNALTHSSV